MQAVANQTRAKDVKEFRTRFSARLETLATNQYLLINRKWEDPVLAEIIEAEFGPFARIWEERVDGDPLIGWDLPEQLEDAGFSVLDLAMSATKALETLSEQHCDAAVLDVNLGEHTSAEVARLLTARAIPFVTVSGYSSDQLEPVLQTGAHLRKPVRVEQLIELLRKRRALTLHRLLPRDTLARGIKRFPTSPAGA